MLSVAASLGLRILNDDKSHAKTIRWCTGGGDIIHLSLSTHTGCAADVLIDADRVIKVRTLKESQNIIQLYIASMEYHREPQIHKDHDI